MRKFTRLIIILSIFVFTLSLNPFVFSNAENDKKETKKDFIKWVENKVSYQIMQKAYEYDVKSINSPTHYKFVDLIAYCAFKNGNRFSYKKDLRNMTSLIDKLNNGQTMKDIVGDNKYYKYYYDSYNAIFSEFIGRYYDTTTNTIKYGIKAYSPIAKNFWASGSDDFGNARGYGFKRRHLGHDMFGGVGTPIIAVESGIIKEIGWNRFGGWRIGIRSHDTKRYYYYAHLRKDRPYALNIKAGDFVKAGQVIGYLGVTGYSFNENRNMKTRPHLHFGMQLIFDESQVDGPEIWIDVYKICKFLNKNKAQVVKDKETGHYQSVNLRESII